MFKLITAYTLQRKMRIYRTEYTINGWQYITFVITKNYCTGYAKHYDILSDS